MNSIERLCGAKELNDHRLEDGGFVNRLKPTKDLRNLVYFNWLMAFGHIAVFIFA